MRQKDFSQLGLFLALAFRTRLLSLGALFRGLGPATAAPLPWLRLRLNKVPISRSLDRCFVVVIVSLAAIAATFVITTLSAAGSTTAAATPNSQLFLGL